jgi:hypothetical protein
MSSLIPQVGSLDNLAGLHGFDVIFHDHSAHLQRIILKNDVE